MLYNILFIELIFAVFNSSKEKSTIKVMLNKTKLNCWEQTLFSVPFSIDFWLNGWLKTAFHKKRRGLQLIKISSKSDRPQLSAGLFFSDLSYRILDESLIRKLLFGCFLAEPTSFSKKKQNKMQKIRHSKLSLVRPN